MRHLFKDAAWSHKLKARNVDEFLFSLTGANLNEPSSKNRCLSLQFHSNWNYLVQFYGYLALFWPINLNATFTLP
jgi:hypothetical protein